MARAGECEEVYEGDDCLASKSEQPKSNSPTREVDPLSFDFLSSSPSSLSNPSKNDETGYQQHTTTVLLPPSKSTPPNGYSSLTSLPTNPNPSLPAHSSNTALPNVTPCGTPIALLNSIPHPWNLHGLTGRTISPGSTSMTVVCIALHVSGAETARMEGERRAHDSSQSFWVRKRSAEAFVKDLRSSVVAAEVGSGGSEGEGREEGKWEWARGEGWREVEGGAGNWRSWEERKERAFCSWFERVKAM